MPVSVQNPDPRSLARRPADDLLAPATRMGAVELLVRDLDAMIAFYSEGVTLDTWGTAGAGLRAAALGLGQVNIDLPSADDVDALQRRLTDHRVPVRHDGAVLRFDDPWGTLLQVGVGAS